MTDTDRINYLIRNDLTLNIGTLNGWSVAVLHLNGPADKKIVRGDVREVVDAAINEEKP